MLKTFTLKNGVKVATYHLPNVKSIHLRAIVKCGSIVESAETNGVAHFMEHMLVQGIPSYPNVEAFSGYIESLAGTYSAHTSRYTVDFSITLPKTHIADAIQITGEVMFAPLFVPEALEKERHAVISEITQKMDSHFFTLNEFTRKTRFIKNHYMLQLPGGSLPVVKQLTRDDLIMFWQTYFVPKNLYLVMIGDFAEPESRQLLDHAFGSKSSEKSFVDYPQTTITDYSNRTIALRHDKNVKTNYVTVSFLALGFSDSRENADLRERQSLALTILGELRNSRLFKLLRYQKGLVYDCGVGASLLPGTGYVQVYAEVTTERLHEVLELIAKELLAYVAEGPTEDELAFAKNYLNNQWLMSFDHPSSIADWVESELLEDDIIRMPEEYTEILAKISRQDIIDVMQTYWQFNKLNVVVQGPMSNSVAEKDFVTQTFAPLV